MDIKKIFADNLKKLRNEKGLTQAQVAEMVGISHRYYVKIEHGQSWPASETFAAISKVLRSPPAAFLKQTGDIAIQRMRTESSYKMALRKIKNVLKDFDE